MRRRATRAKARDEGRPPVPRKAPTSRDPKVRDLEKRLAESLEREKATCHALTEALDQQTATSEILRAISASPNDVQPVFDAITKSALGLLRGFGASLTRVVGDDLHLAALTSTDPAGDEAIRSMFPMPRSRAPFFSDAAGVIADMEAAVGIAPEAREAARQRGYRSLVVVPLNSDNRVVGYLLVSRVEAGGFTDGETELLKTFADQAVIAIENARLFTELGEKNRALTESLEQQTATADILQVISRSPTDVEPVFEAVVTSAARLCEAHDVAMLLVDGDDLRLVAGVGPLCMSIPPDFRIRLTQGSAAARAVVDRAIVHIHDFAAESEEEYPVEREFARRFGHRSMLAVPLLREGVPMGVVCAFRLEVRPFPDQQIALLRTFADQAVIAIENVRLFNETKEALEQQTATADILHVISRSPTDVQPVFDTIVTRARALTDAHACGVFLLHGDVVSIAAHDSLTDEWRQEYPRVASANTVSGRAMLGRTIVHVTDLKTDPDYEGAPGRRVNIRTVLAAPMLREGQTIGAIVVWRSEVMSFSDKQIALLQTFANQAIIAIENVRLFTELQTSNRELTTALDAQTATSDILRVISRSQTDVRPVFDAIVNSAVRLLRARSGTLSRIVGDQIELAAHTSTDEAGDAATRVAFPQPLSFGGVHAQTIRNRAPLNIVDAQTDPRLPEATHTYARVRGYRSQGAVPILRQDEAIGALAVTRRELGGFTDEEIALLQTFADQAVIAIENARLLTELRARTQELTHSVEQLTALGEVGRAVSSTLDLETVLTTIVSRAVQLSGLDGGVVFEYDEDTEEFVHRAATETGGGLAEARRTTRIRKGEGVVGRTAVTLEPAQVPDITVPGVYESRLRENLIESGIRAILAVPMARDDRLIGCLVVSRNAPGDFPAETIELLRTFATQSALAIQNARLFREIESKSRELEAASRHKSEFLANMSHELRTPLNAIIGFSEVLSERMFGDLTEKQDEYLKDIHASGQHLLSLINDILDLSKIEAGRMELELKDFDLPQAIGNAVTLVRERAGRRGIALHQAVDQRVGQVRGDERKVKQVLLNLLSNALKFTPEGGRVDVRATVVDGMAEVSVTDTGIGIDPEDREAVFEEFRQVGTADKKVEGTGLGLALSRKFIELHGGRIWVQSEVGRGSTFAFTLPLTMDHRPQASE